MSHLYEIYHVYDVDGGFGDAIEKTDQVACVEATEEEIQEFLKIWDKPRIYDHPYADLRHHHVVCKPVKIMELSEIQPYDPETREWPDLPEGEFWFHKYIDGKWVEDNEYDEY